MTHVQTKFNESRPKFSTKKRMDGILKIYYVSAFGISLHFALFLSLETQGIPSIELGKITKLGSAFAQRAKT